MVVGLTGGIGSGKSTIAKALQLRGYAVYDTDSRAKEIIVSDAKIREDIIGLLGEDAYQGNVCCKTGKFMVPYRCCSGFW